MKHKNSLVNLLAFQIMLLLLLSCMEIYSQGRGGLRGIVTDSTSSEALAYSNIFIKELSTGTSTDNKGYFLFPSLEAGNSYTLVASYIGYDSKEIIVNIDENRITHVEIELSPSSVELQTVEKVGEKIIESNAADIGLRRIALKELEALPKGVETDVFRSLQYMAGVRTTSDVSARYYVRGSASNQNLVLLEGTTIYNPFHAMGLFSAVDPEIINNIEFYKGGYTADYGGRIASVLSILPKEGNKNEFGGSASLSMLTGKVMVEGPLPKGSFILSARKSHSTSILNKFLDGNNIPVDFHDLFFKAHYADLDNATGSKFTVYGFLSNDNILYDDPLKADYKWNNFLYGFKWFYVGDSPLYIELGISQSRFKGELTPNQSIAKPQLNKVSDTSLDAYFNYIFDSKDEISVGVQIKDVSTELYLENARGAVSDIGTSGTNISAFAKFKFLRFENFGVDIGARATLTRLSGGGGETNPIEPRISMTYRIFPSLAIKAAYGQYQQDLTTLSDETEIISLYEPWIVIPDYLETSRATHYSGGFEFRPIDNFSLEVEGYYKDIQNLLAINREKIYSSDRDLVAGTGESYGLEVMTTYAPSIFRFSAAYTLAWAYKEIDDWIYYPKYDSRHTFNISLEVNMGSGWRLSSVWNYSTGLPFTQVAGFYDKVYIDDPNDPSNIFDPVRPYAILGDLNISRMPDYHRLDFSLSKKMSLFSLDLEINFSILNVYNRKNVFYFDRKTSERVNSLPFLPTVSIRGEL